MNKHLFVALVITLLVSRLAQACLHFNKDYKTSIEEGRKIAFLFHDGKFAHMVVKTDVEVRKGRLPKRLAWVLPFPTLPTQYEEVDEKVFKELFALLNEEKLSKAALQRSDRQGVYAGNSAPAFHLHPKVEVGKYRIQPIEILGPSNANDFNNWLMKNHFNPMPMQNQQRYLTKGAVFLAIETSPNGQQAHLKPLHISYPSETLSFPLRFTHDTRRFGMDLFVHTTEQFQPLDTPSYFDFTEQIPASRSKTSPHLAKLIQGRPGYITWFSGNDLNGPGKALSELADDPRFKP